MLIQPRLSPAGVGHLDAWVILAPGPGKYRGQICNGPFPTRQRAREVCFLLHGPGYRVARARFIVAVAV